MTLAVEEALVLEVALVEAEESLVLEVSRVEAVLLAVNCSA
jgi:hypothetical protein